MAGIDILSNGLRSLTGAVTKAYLKFEDERITSKDINVQPIRARGAALPANMTGLQKVTASVQAVVSEKTDSLANSIGRLMAGANADDFSSGKVYEVKFNPSELTFQAYGGAKVQKMNYMENEQIKGEFVEMKPRIMMNVPLVFDDYERTDAFMMEKFGDATAAARTIVSGIATGVSGKTFSVRPQVEGFIAALRNEKTRKVTFYWGNMAYKGMLEVVSAEYTMFNMEGHPIRALVNLGILLIDENVKNGDMGYWKTSYEKAFAGEGSSLGSKMDNVGNLLNIKL